MLNGNMYPKGNNISLDCGNRPKQAPDRVAPSPVPQAAPRPVGLWLRWGYYPIGTWNETHLSPIPWLQALLQTNSYSYPDPLASTVAWRPQPCQKCWQATALSVLLPTKLSTVKTWQLNSKKSLRETLVATELTLCLLHSSPGLLFSLLPFRWFKGPSFNFFGRARLTPAKARRKMCFLCRVSFPGSSYVSECTHGLFPFWLSSDLP